MNEEELFSLNVWTQGLGDDKKRPVMLWLHGGGFHVGSSNDPMTYGKALAKKGEEVMVSINHRLNILGFLDLSAYGPQYATSANVVMLDFVKALEWVQNSIMNFGNIYQIVPFLARLHKKRPCVGGRTPINHFMYHKLIG